MFWWWSEAENWKGFLAINGTNFEYNNVELSTETENNDFWYGTSSGSLDHDNFELRANKML